MTVPVTSLDDHSNHCVQWLKDDIGRLEAVGRALSLCVVILQLYTLDRACELQEPSITINTLRLVHMDICPQIC